MENNTKNKNKDSLFKGLFSISENFIDLYKECSGKELQPSDLKRFDLNSSVVNRHLFNDISYLTSDEKLLLLKEHQSTPNPNMPEREFLYFAELIQNWLTLNELYLSSRMKINIPKPEFYVCYNGKLPYNKETLTFGNEFLKVNVKLVDINFANLKFKEQSNKLAGYSYFYSQFDLKKEAGATKEQAFNYAREMCIKNGYLLGIVDKEEFIMQYRPLIDWEDELRYEGELKGLEKGIEKGIEKGKILIAKNALSMNMPIDNIVKLTGLAYEEIEVLQGQKN